MWTWTWRSTKYAAFRSCGSSASSTCTARRGCATCSSRSSTTTRRTSPSTSPPRVHRLDRRRGTRRGLEAGAAAARVVDRVDRTDTASDAGARAHRTHEGVRRRARALSAHLEPHDLAGAAGASDAPFVAQRIDDVEPPTVLVRLCRRRAEHRVARIVVLHLDAGGTPIVNREAHRDARLAWRTAFVTTSLTINTTAS